MESPAMTFKGIFHNIISVAEQVNKSMDQIATESANPDQENQGANVYQDDLANGTSGGQVTNESPLSERACATLQQVQRSASRAQTVTELHDRLFTTIQAEFLNISCLLDQAQNSNDDAMEIGRQAAAWGDQIDRIYRLTDTFRSLEVDICTYNQQLLTRLEPVQDPRVKGQMQSTSQSWQDKAARRRNYYVPRTEGDPLRNRFRVIEKRYLEEQKQRKKLQPFTDGLADLKGRIQSLADLMDTKANQETLLKLTEQVQQLVTKVDVLAVQISDIVKAAVNEEFSPQQAYIQAKELVNKFKFKEAIPLLKTAVYGGVLDAWFWFDYLSVAGGSVGIQVGRKALAEDVSTAWINETIKRDIESVAEDAESLFRKAHWRLTKKGDNKAAMELYQKADAQDYLLASLSLAADYWERKDTLFAIQHARKAVDGGLIVAEGIIAACLLEARQDVSLEALAEAVGHPVDAHYVIELARKSALAGSAIGAVALSSCYENGIGTEVDQELANQWAIHASCAFFNMSEVEWNAGVDALAKVMPDKCLIV